MATAYAITLEEWLRSHNTFSNANATNSDV